MPTPNKISPFGHHARCDRRWMAIGWAHCAGCCATFSSVTLFDKHRVAVLTEHGPCLKPDEIMSGGERAMFWDEGTKIWRGPPKTDEEIGRIREFPR